MMRYPTVDLALKILIIRNLLVLLLILRDLKLFCKDLFEFKLSVGRAWILLHLLKLAHEFHVLEEVYLQFCQLIVEAPFANLNGFCYIRLKGELFGRRLPVEKGTFHLRRSSLWVRLFDIFFTSLKYISPFWLFLENDWFCCPNQQVFMLHGILLYI